MPRGQCPAQDSDTGWFFENINKVDKPPARATDRDANIQEGTVPQTQDPEWEPGRPEQGAPSACLPLGHRPPSPHRADREVIISNPPKQRQARGCAGEPHQTWHKLSQETGGEGAFPAHSVTSTLARRTARKRPLPAVSLLRTDGKRPAHNVSRQLSTSNWKLASAHFQPRGGRLGLAESVQSGRRQSDGEITAPSGGFSTDSDHKPSSGPSGRLAS